jgi:predicted TIM-barrel fold metal-dependent hydrolase
MMPPSGGACDAAGRVRRTRGLCSAASQPSQPEEGAALDVEHLRLVDHHCHGVTNGDLDRSAFEGLISESFDPAPPGTSHFDAPLGLAIRRWCAPLLDLEPFVDPDAYVDRRRALGADEVARRFLSAAGIGALLIDTGYRADELHDLDGMRGLVDAGVHEIVRLEAVAESVAASGIDAAAYPKAYADALDEAARDAVGLKTIVAYRGGFDFDPSPPDETDVIRAAGGFLGADGSGGSALRDPVLLRFGIWSGVRLARERGLPLQFHVGWGDPDLDLHRTDPTLLTALIRQLAPLGVDVTLLHCYPFHRNAGYLAAMYPNVYLDVGSALHYLGPSSGRLLAEAMEVAPFSKLLFSSDAFGVAEQYHLGALLFRRALTRILERWIADDHCDAATAERIAAGIAGGNARRIYPLPDGA